LIYPERAAPELFASAEIVKPPGVEPVNAVSRAHETDEDAEKATALDPVVTLTYGEKPPAIGADHVLRLTFRVSFADDVSVAD